MKTWPTLRGFMPSKTARTSATIHNDRLRRRGTACTPRASARNWALPRLLGAQRCAGVGSAIGFLQSAPFSFEATRSVFAQFIAFEPIFDH